jgi:hypothetical protein
VTNPTAPLRDLRALRGEPALALRSSSSARSEAGSVPPRENRSSDSGPRTSDLGPPSPSASLPLSTRDEIEFTSRAIWLQTRAKSIRFRTESDKRNVLIILDLARDAVLRAPLTEEPG